MRGTKDSFRIWLSQHQQMNYTTYTKLPTERKLVIQKEYKTC